MDDIVGNSRIPIINLEFLVKNSRIPRQKSLGILEFLKRYPLTPRKLEFL